MAVRVKSVFKMALVLLLVTALLFLIQLGRPALPVNTQMGGDFNLRSTHLGIVGMQDFAGKVVLLSFGYTSCPDICPMVVSRMNQVAKTLRKRSPKAADQLQLAFITVDPVTDTVSKLKAYLTFFNPDIVGFSGSLGELQAVAAKYGVVAMPEPDTEQGDVRFAHSDYMYLLDQQGRVRKLYATGDDLSALQPDIDSLLNEQRNLWQRIQAFFD